MYFRLVWDMPWIILIYTWELFDILLNLPDICMKHDTKHACDDAGLCLESTWYMRGNAECVLRICLEYAGNFPEIYLRIVWDMPDIFLRFAWDLPWFAWDLNEIYMRLGWYLHEISKIFAWDLREICMKFTWDLLEICMILAWDKPD